MFDIGATELLVIAIVAILAIGPKDMPLALRTAGRWMGKVRSISNHFRSGVETMIREAELQDMEKQWREKNRAIMEKHPDVGQFSDAGTDAGANASADASAEASAEARMEPLPNMTGERPSDADDAPDSARDTASTNAPSGPRQLDTSAIAKTAPADTGKVAGDTDAPSGKRPTQSGEDAA